MGKSVAQMLADLRVDIDRAAPGLLQGFDNAAHEAMAEINKGKASAKRRISKWVALGYVGVAAAAFAAGAIFVDLVARYG